ncbi:hypothetical protein K523DRAFT_45648 [Schizophyllum commune Tattone D]|nr:hypothetical protein K523DRAFT_45648 [Schizophyllum commune Tattone D]
MTVVDHTSSHASRVPAAQSDPVCCRAIRRHLSYWRGWLPLARSTLRFSRPTAGRRGQRKVVGYDAPRFFPRRAHAWVLSRLSWLARCARSMSPSVVTSVTPAELDRGASFYVRGLGCSGPYLPGRSSSAKMRRSFARERGERVNFAGGMVDGTFTVRSGRVGSGPVA